MVQYLDSSRGRPEEALGNWLKAKLVAGVRSFRCQTGFFSLAALRDHLEILREVDVVRLVLGANAPEQPTAEDIRALVPLLTNPDRRSLTIVRCAGSTLFHPKVVHVIGPTGAATGYVGSANLTEAGLGRNIEAGVLLAEGSEAALAAMADSIDAWAARADEGVFHVRGPEDVERLLLDGVLVTASARRASRAAVRGTAVGAKRGPGLRVGAMWRPTVRVMPPRAGDEEAAEAATEVGDDLGEGARVTPLRWCKQLPRNDAQQPKNPNSNVRGILGLSQAGWDIEAATYFREEFFGLEQWVEEGEKEECHVTFAVEFPGRGKDQRTLRVSHKPSRRSDQGNIVTHLHWGRDLIAWLRRHSQVDKWVVIERHEDQTYSLRIQARRPDWAPGDRDGRR